MVGWLRSPEPPAVPPEAIIAVIVVSCAFGAFALTLAWGHSRAGKPPTN